MPLSQQHSSNMKSSPRQRRRRNTLVQLACVSQMMWSSTAFTSTSSTTSFTGGVVTLPLHRQEERHPMLSTPSFYRRSALQMAFSSPTSQSIINDTNGKKKKIFPRLTAAEEKELLRQAVESRRLRQLEQDWAMMSPDKTTLPFLSKRAHEAGYGDDMEAYEAALTDGQVARERLVTHNMGLVQYCVTQIVGTKISTKSRLNSLSREDLIQEGAIGLARAVDKWNPAIGGKFSTYAVYWVRAAVLRCIAERDDVVRVPNHITEAVNKINKAALHLGINMEDVVGVGSFGSSSTGSWKRAQAAKELAEEAGLSERNFEEALKARRRRTSGGYVAFESWMQQGRDLTADIPTSEGNNSGSAASSALVTEQLRNTLAPFLRPKEMEALSWRYGLFQETTENVESSSPAARAQSYLVQAEEDLFGSNSVASTTMTSTQTTAKKSKSADQSSSMSSQPEMTKEGRWGEAMTFNEVGKRMQVSAEYTRRLCHGALAKLRQAAEDGQLEPALLV